MLILALKFTQTKLHCSNWSLLWFGHYHGKPEVLNLLTIYQTQCQKQPGQKYTEKMTCDDCVSVSSPEIKNMWRPRQVPWCAYFLFFAKFAEWISSTSKENSFKTHGRYYHVELVAIITKCGHNKNMLMSAFD